MKTIIAGSRKLTDYDVVKNTILESGFDISVVISGTARGVDTLGEKYAEENNIPIMKFPAKWEVYRNAAGPIRNQEMANVADALIVIILDDSKGSLHMLECARKLGLKTYIKKIYSNNEPSGIMQFLE